MAHLRTCTLCEALCGVAIDTDAGAIRRIRGNPEDVLSHGHICPKGVALQDLHTDPDRIRQPMRRVGERWHPVSWDDALSETAHRLHDIQTAYGRHAVGMYLGNPNAHNYGSILGNPALARAIRTKNRYSATSSDQLPHMFAALLLFGHQLLLPVPDLDRCDLLIVAGANPWASNGSLMSAGDVRTRIGAIGARGGRVIVLDPRRTETAKNAHAHHFVRPGMDALWLMSMIHVLFEEDLVDSGSWRDWTDGLDTLRALAAPFTPDATAPSTGIAPSTLRALTRDLASAKRAGLYGRFGTCTHIFGGITAWALYVVNLLTGHLDRPGGLMFTDPAVDVVGLTESMGDTGHYAAWHSRVRGLPEFGGELPASELADEIITPGDRQIKAMITLAGNPVLSAAHGNRLESAFGKLEFYVAIDMYRNATTRLADLILPPTSPLERDHYGLIFHALSVRNTAKYSPPLFAPGPGVRDDFDILTELAERLLRVKGGVRAHAESLAIRAYRKLGPRRILDLLLRRGPYGLSIGHLDAHPHGVDLGPLRAGLPGKLRTPNRRIRLVPDPILSDLPRLRASLAQRPQPGTLSLIGRRQLRSNNSWLHNSSRLMKGKPRCTLLMHPEDAKRSGLQDGDMAAITSRTGQVEAPVALSDEMMPGVVSLPHGWGHRRPGVTMRVAQARPGVSINDLTDEEHVDPLTGNAGFSGVPVTVSPAPSA